MTATAADLRAVADVARVVDDMAGLLHCWPLLQTRAQRANVRDALLAFAEAVRRHAEALNVDP